MTTLGTKKITYTGIMMAVVFIATSAIKIPIPITGGYINFGDAFVMLSGIILGPIYGALAAGVGSSLSDLIGPYAQWALPTLIIKASMAFIIGFLALKKDNKKVIFLSTSLFAIVWIGFNFALHSILSGNISTNSMELALQLEGITNTSELLNLATHTQSKLFMASLFIPILLGLILLLFLKLSDIRFLAVYSLSFVISGTFMIIGYYFAYYLLYGNYIVPIFEVPLNIIQFACGLVVVHLLLPITQKIMKMNMKTTEH